MDLCEWNLLFASATGGVLQMGAICTTDSFTQTNSIIGLSFVYNNLSGILPQGKTQDAADMVMSKPDFRYLTHTLLCWWFCLCTFRARGTDHPHLPGVYGTLHSRYAAGQLW